MDIFIWFGIVFCLSQSAMFSGLNLAFFSITKLRLEIEASHNNKSAQKVLEMRQDSNFLLTTILWGNVGINVLLTLLSNSVMTGLLAFLFSTFLITFMGEIIPQAYFSRHALKMASALAPVLRFYQIVLYPFAKPSAKVLDVWLGSETIQYFKEKSLKQLIQKHVEDTEDIDLVEGLGAINFLSLDDLFVDEEGEVIHPDSIIALPVKKNRIDFPKTKASRKDPFLQRLNQSGKKWVIITNPQNEPELVLDVDGFIRAALWDDRSYDPYEFCHRPIIIKNSKLNMGKAIQMFTVADNDDRISRDVILLWSDKKKIITGSDILSRLLHGVL